MEKEEIKKSTSSEESVSPKAIPCLLITFIAIVVFFGLIIGICSL